VAAWLLLGTLYVLNTSNDHYGHDYGGHVEYTQLVAQMVPAMHRLPGPYVGWQTFHPPLYYLINTALAPASPGHPRYVRLMSVAFGAAVLALIAHVLSRIPVSPAAQGLTLLFTASTPAYLFVFTAYNNDALAVLESVALLILAYRLSTRWSLPSALLFLLVATAGLYTKYTVIYTVGVVMGMVVLGMIRGRVPHRLGRRLLALGALAGVLFLPWLVGHNYAYAHKLFPFNSENGINAELRLPKGALATILTPPGISNGEWADPFTHQWEATGNKKTSYLAYLLASSIFGEYSFAEPSPALPWVILYAHLILLGMSLRVIRHSRLTRAAALSIGLGVLALTSFVLRLPYAPTMDYRYVAWIWLPLSILYAALLETSRPFLVRIPWHPYPNAIVWISAPASLMTVAVAGHVLLLTHTLF
jgi:hypothetical protein